jgi:hypothetical protein
VRIERLGKFTSSLSLRHRAFAGDPNRTSIKSRSATARRCEQQDFAFLLARDRIFHHEKKNPFSSHFDYSHSG